MNTPFFFGYGSLVNRRTHVYTDAHPARITGWRRIWRHTDVRDAAFLSVQRDPSTTLSGLIAAVPGGDWAALDERETSYDRLPTGEEVEHALGRALDIQIYSVPAQLDVVPEGTHPILLSYLDVVIQGYLTEFGEEGADAFFASTDGWDAPVLNDRDDPAYPRHQLLSAEERGVVDGWLRKLSATILDPA